MKEMRRKDRALTEEKAWEIIKNGEIGFLATSGQESQPYVVPLSYHCEGKSIYFHSALEGHKIENIQKNNKVSFCVVGSAQAVYNGSFTVRYASAIAFGTATLLTQPEEREKALYQLCEKYLPGDMAKAPESIARYAKSTAVYKIEVTAITGKANPAKPE